MAYEVQHFTTAGDITQNATDSQQLYVDKLQGLDLVVGTPTDQQILAWVAGSSELQFISNPGNPAGVYVNRTPVTTATFNILTTHQLLAVSYAGDCTLTLPAAVAGKAFVIKDESGAANVNQIDIVGPTGVTIDGASTFSIKAKYGSISLYSDGTNWFVF